MNLIVPMAGMGKRMRPHTLTVPKPLVPVAGKPIVQLLVEDIAKVCPEPIARVGFIIKESFGHEVEEQLKAVASSIGAVGEIYYQEQALGTAHAVYCAEPLLDGPCIVAFADTLFRAEFRLEADKDGIIWVQKVPNPSAFGVIKLDDHGVITDFVEKPKEFVSDLAIIGIYYFKQGAQLRAEIKHLLDERLTVNGEYQLTDALENMKQKGTRFVPGQVQEWLDCGNKDATVYSNQRYLEFIRDRGDLVASSASLEHSVIIPPVYLGEGVQVKNSVVGPYVSIGGGSTVENCRISNSIVQKDTKIKNAVIANSMIGNNVYYGGKAEDLSIGDFTQIER